MPLRPLPSKSAHYPARCAVTDPCQNTEKRSALRITREVELLGGQVNAYHTRENLVLQAKFLKDDLPYFAELLAEVMSKTRYSSASSSEDGTCH